MLSLETIGVHSCLPLYSRVSCLLPASSTHALPIDSTPRFKGAFRHLRFDSKNGAEAEDFVERKVAERPSKNDGNIFEEKGISGIHVPRQRYISTSKVEILDAIISQFVSAEDANDFVLLSSFLDSILHAEHKRVLDKMRMHYSSCRTQDFEQPNANFQHAFMKLLCDARFEELSAKDLMLAYALNNDYLLTLPIYVDWKKALASNAIIFRRGYGTEKQKGLLIVEKLDYLQSKLLQEIFFNLSRPLKEMGSWINEKVVNSSSEAIHEPTWIDKVKLWLAEQFSVESTWSMDNGKDINQFELDGTSERGLPIWLAAQKAILQYEGFLSQAGPRGRLLRRFFTWVGIIPTIPRASMNLQKNLGTHDSSGSNFLRRITLSNIWETVAIESSDNSAWKMFKSAISILFSQSTLQEPTFHELILLYGEKTKQGEVDVKEAPPFQMKIYERIPIPDLPVIFPHKKFSFRIIDTLRLDAASILGLLAYVINYKFENIVSSWSAVILDVVAISALVIYIIRVALGYKQTRDRYQLLVNRTLYEKTLASGFGSVYFLLDASEQQQFKEAILVYGLLLQYDDYEGPFHQSIKDACEKLMYDTFSEKIEMLVDDPLALLLKLGLVVETTQQEGKITLRAVRCPTALQNLKKHWDSLIG